MRLVDLDPQWLIFNGRRVGFHFISPVKPEWRQSCIVAPLTREEQWDLLPEDTQGCRPECKWEIQGGVDNAAFETLTVTPSLDGSRGGLWHGHITNGAIVGGI